jgi:hypothetical protein
MKTVVLLLSALFAFSGPSAAQGVEMDDFDPSQISGLGKTSSVSDAVKLTETNVQGWADSVWITFYREINNYDEFGRLGEQLVQQANQYGGWTTVEREVYSRDAAGNVAEHLSQSQDQNGSLEDDTRELFSFDDRGNEVERVLQGWRGAQWESVSRDVRTFDEKGREATHAVLNWNGVDWVPVYRWTYTYNEVDSLRETLREDRDIVDGWKPFILTTFTYNESSQLVEKTETIWNGEEWFPIRRESHSYDVFGNHTELLEQAWTETSWTNQTRMLFQYNQLNKPTEFVRQSWYSESWNNREREVYAYDSTGNRTETLTQNWRTTDWVNDIRNSVAFDSLGNAIETIQERWLEDEWKKFFRVLFTYERIQASVSQVTLVSPAEGAEGVSPFGPLEWMPVTTADRYHIQIDVDARFASLVVNDSTTKTTSVKLTEPLAYNTTYFWRVRGIGPDGVGPWSEVRSFTVAIGTASEDESVVPGRFALHQNYPNPFNPATSISFELDEPGRVTLSIYDVTGELVEDVVSADYQAGSHTVNFDAAKLPSGTYVYRLRMGEVSLARLLTVMK